MMTLTNSSRKRQCTEDTDYMPVTKRMNSLHIDVMTNGFNEQLINQFEGNSSDSQSRDSCLGRSQSQSHCHSINCINNSQNCVHILNAYCPQLDAHSNPIYYEPNRVLFEAHQQRCHRMSNRHLFTRK